MTETCRPFAPGSRTAPDPQDSFLESKGFYRKHTARDASSLFRVVSEQVFDIQLYHEMVREDCIGYIEKHRKDFERDMDKNYFYYLSLLRKPRTSGNLLELRALAHCYKRNVLLFQQYNVGTWFVNEVAYGDKEPLRVFFSPDRHFDTVYTKAFVELAAKCQAMVYELLYIKVFRLPDVEYAVERMLYDQDELKTKPLVDDDTKYQTMTGKVCQFDSHETTECVLDNDKLCHFHNRENFQELVDTYTTSQAIYNKKLSPKREKQLDSFLYESNKSCVRQLLIEKITPFPYKVAKALDLSIYRNIEFDLWSEGRKELRLKWMEANNAGDCQKYGFESGNEKFNDYQAMKVFGAKGNHYPKRYYKGEILDEKSGVSCLADTGYISREQYEEMSDEQKKKYVLLNDQPASSICKVESLTGFHNFQPCFQQDMIVLPAGLNHNNQNGQRGGFGQKSRRGRGGQHGGQMHNHHNQQMGYNNAPTHNIINQQEEKQECVEYTNNNPNEVQYMPYYPPVPTGGFYEQQYLVQYENAVPVAQTMPAQYQVAAPQAAWSQGYYNGQPAALPPMPQPVVQQYAVYPPGGYTYYTHDQLRLRTDPQFQPVPYTPFPPYTNIPAGQMMQIAGSNMVPDSLGLINAKDLLPNINYVVKESTEPNGKDINVSDLITLQFFFNLGLKYFRCHQHINQIDQPHIEHHQQDVQQPQQQQQQMQLIPVADQRPPSKGHTDHDNRANGNTPTTTKGFTFGPGGNSNGNRHNGPGNVNSNQNYRKPFTNNRVYQNKRNDVKFNPNVKNVHKNNNNSNNNLAPTNGSAPQQPNAHSPILAVTENNAITDNNNNNGQNPMYPVYATQYLPYYTNDLNEAAGGVMAQQFVVPYAPAQMNPSIMTPTDPGNDPTQYPGNFASFVYAPAFVPPMPTTPITSAGAPQNYVVYSPMVQPPTPQPVVTISSTNSSTTNTFNSSGSM